MWLHELGHLAIARRLGLDVGPIVFVPLIGATQRLRKAPASASDGAQIALAGPLCGLLFALVCKLAFLALHHPALALLGTAHAVLAMLDAIPFGMLDGRRIFAALSRRHRAGCACAVGSLALATHALYLAPVCVVLVWSITQPAPARSPSWIAAVYIVLMVAGALLV
jgi:Zn-dependent protease